ncbi:hypothetical protein LINPERPRIM_LOCUS27252 [Linum perenne]
MVSSVRPCRESCICNLEYTRYDQNSIILEHFCEYYSDLSGPILCPVLGSITPLFIPNSRIRPIRLIVLCASLITFLYSPVPRIQFYPSMAKSQII